MQKGDRAADKAHAGMTLVLSGMGFLAHSCGSSAHLNLLLLALFPPGGSLGISSSYPTLQRAILPAAPQICFPL